MKGQLMGMTLVFAVLTVLVSSGNAWAEQAGEHRCYGRYQLVNGEYDIKLKPTGSDQVEYKTHRTMFLVDSDTGRVWLFVAESDETKGRWGWIPSRGYRPTEETPSRIR